MKNVAVIFGSRSPEHDISIITALSAVIEPLKLSGSYHPIPVYISKTGQWYSDPVLSDIVFYSTGDLASKLARLRKIQLYFDQGLYLVRAGLRIRKTPIDIVFPATHGTYGEDGSLMGLMRMADVPFVGCDMPASVIAMDKGLCKTVLSEAGLKSVNYQIIASDSFRSDSKEALKRCGTMTYPLFVKPVHLGSSIAISRVNETKELENAIEVATHYDDRVIVEEAVVDLIEVTVPIIGNDELRPAMVEEVLNKPANFFDFDKKYLHGGKGKKIGAKSANRFSRIPARLPKELYQRCLDIAQKAYRAIDACGIARVDLLIDTRTKEIYVNEINPLPGSLYQHNWVASGLSNVDLVTKLLELAEQRHSERQRLTTTFESGFLKQF